MVLPGLTPVPPQSYARSCPDLTPVLCPVLPGSYPRSCPVLLTVLPGLTPGPARGLPTVLPGLTHGPAWSYPWSCPGFTHGPNRSHARSCLVLPLVQPWSYPWSCPSLTPGPALILFPVLPGLTPGAALAQVQAGLQAVLSVQQVGQVVEDGGQLQDVLAAADVPKLQTSLLWVYTNREGFVSNRKQQTQSPVLV